jgi:GNAT superfamily N-acetyltransferase
MTHPQGTQLRISRQELSRLVGCSREMAGRVLKKLEADGTLHAHGSELARITALVVAPECARAGIGRLLLREVEQLSRRHGIHRIEVTSNARRVDAHAFYRDCGYSDDSRRFVKMLCD